MAELVWWAGFALAVLAYCALKAAYYHGKVAGIEAARRIMHEEFSKRG